MLSRAELDDLLGHLETAGFRAAIGHRADILQVLAVHAGRFAAKDRLAEAGRLIGPVLCANAEEQRRFATVFGRWCAHRTRTAAPERPAPAAPPPAPTVPAVSPSAPVELPSRWLSALGAGAVLVTLLVLAFNNEGLRVPRAGGGHWTAVDQLGTGSAPRTVRGEAIRNSDGTGILRLAGLVAPILILAFWFHWRALARKVVRERFPDDHEPSLARMSADEEAIDALFPRAALAGLAEYRRWYGHGERGVDIERSIQRTVRSGGRPVLVGRAERHAQTYLALIETRSSADHAAEHARALVQLLLEREVPVEVYRFGQTPEQVTPESGRGQALSLALLARKSPGARILIFAHPDTCLRDDPESRSGSGASAGSEHWARPRASAAPWLANLMEAHRCAIISPDCQPTDIAGPLDCPVFPPTVSAMAHLPRVLDGSSHWRAEAQWEGGPDRNEALRELQARAVRGSPPSARRAALVCALGPDLHPWVASAAVYPRLSFELTVYLGARLRGSDGQPLLCESRLIELTRLAWFREAQIPEPVREDLIAGLSRTQARAARELVFGLLGGVLAHRPEALPEAGIDRHTRDLIKTYLRTRGGGQAVADRLFTRFMLAPRWPLRSLAIPERLARVLGFRLDAAPLVAVLLAIASVSGLGGLVDWIEAYFPQFNAFVLEHRIGFGIALYVTLIVAWSGFWTSVMLSPRYEKFTSELWRRRVRLDDFQPGAGPGARTD